MAGSININQNNNDITIQDQNGKLTITDNNTGTITNVTQPVTDVVTVASLGPAGPAGPAGAIPSTGSFVTTSSFNALTSSFNTFTGSYNTGSFTGSFTGTLNGTASYALTASYLEGYISPFPFSGSAVITGSLTVSGSSTLTNIGPAIFSGSLIVTQGITGSLSGSVTTALTASYAISASQASSSSFAVTASYFNETDPIFVAKSGSFATTSSFNSFTSSYNTGSFTGSFTGSLLGTASYATNALSASYALTSSYLTSLEQQIILSGSLKLDPTQDPDPTGIDLDSTVLFQSSSNTALGYDLYVRQNGNLVKWKWIEGILETGLLYGGAVTYSGSNVFVSPGSGIIADHNATTGSEVSPTIEYVTWSAITQSITNIATQQVTYLYIDNTGTLQQQSTRFTSQQYHDYIPLGAVGHFDYTQVSAFGGGVQTAYDQISQISNFIDAFGPLKMSGYGLTGQPGSLRLSVGSGTSFIHGGFYQNNPEFPSQITTPSQATASLARVQRSGSVIAFDTNAGNLYTVVDPTKYDRDGDGVLHNVGSSNWSIQRVFTDPKTGVLYVYYGQARYTSLLNALQYLPTDPFTEGDTFDFTTFVGFLVLKGNATNIADTANNSILNGGLFRGSGQGSGGGIALSNLDDLTDVSIVSPTNGQALVYNSGIWQNGTPSLATTASYALTSSYATQALSASFAPSTPAFPYTGSAGITGSLTVVGSTTSTQIGAGTTPSGSIRLDVRAQSALSTDLAFRVRNSVDTADILSANGDGTQTWFATANNTLNSIKAGTFNIIQYGNDNFGNIAVGHNSSNMIVPTTAYNTVLGAAASSGVNSSFAIGIGWGSIVNGTGNITIGRARSIGNYAIKIGYDGGASNYGGTNSIHLGKSISGNDILADNVMMTYFDSQSSSTLTRANGSFGLLGQGAYIITNGSGATGTDTFMGNGGNTLVVRNHSSVPSSSILSSFQLYSSASTAGNSAPHFRTEAGNIVKLYTQAAVTSSQGLADALTNLGILTGSSTIPGVSFGPFGIANTSGSYTYYTTFSSSMAAATSGQTVEMFADVTETTNIAIALKDGVNINGNGHTYTLNQAGTANCIQDGGVAVNCAISNITFRRLGGTASSVNTICMYITGASRIKAYSTILIGGATNMRCLTVNNASAEVFGIYAEGYNPTITVTNGTLNDSTAKGLNGGGISVGASGKIIKCIGYGVNVGGISNSGLAIDCFGYDAGIAGFGNSGTAINCTGWSNGSGGFTQGTIGTAINCIGYSTANIGFFINGATNVTSCKGYSTANVGLSMINSVVYDCLGFSTANNGIYAVNSGATITELRSCKAISTSAVAINMANATTGSKIYNTEAYSKWNNAAGHGIVIAGQNTEIVQCTIEVSNASANCISGSSALNTKYANNAFKGSTTAVTANITQSIVNTHDAQGNILI